MTEIASPDPRLETLWRFVRSDLKPSEFEQWIYAELSLEDLLGRELYLETISVDYLDDVAVAELKTTLMAFAEGKSDLRCECVTIPSLALVPIGEDSDIVFRTFEERVRREAEFRWTTAQHCSVCGQWWLAEFDTDRYDAYFLVRLQQQDGERIAAGGGWPPDFEGLYDSDAGHVRWSYQVRSAISIGLGLSWTFADMARERPGIRLAEIAERFGLGRFQAELIARKAMREEGVEIDITREKAPEPVKKAPWFKRLRLWSA